MRAIIIKPGYGVIELDLPEDYQSMKSFFMTEFDGGKGANQRFRRVEYKPYRLLSGDAWYQIYVTDDVPVECTSPCVDNYCPLHGIEASKRT